MSTRSYPEWDRICMFVQYRNGVLVYSRMFKAAGQPVRNKAITIDGRRVPTDQIIYRAVHGKWPLKIPAKLNGARTFSITLEAETKKELIELAQQRNKSLSQLARIAIVKYLRSENAKPLKPPVQQNLQTSPDRGFGHR